jgi:hypothetical protein
LRTRKNIYIIIGSILIVINLLVDLLEIIEHNPVSADQAYSIGYFIGSNILVIFGLIFLRLAYRLHKKIKKIERNELEKSINSIGEQ